MPYAGNEKWNDAKKLSPMDFFFTESPFGSDMGGAQN